MFVEYEGNMTNGPNTLAIGRSFLWLGLALALMGIPLYVVQLLFAGRTDNPWYAPVLATFGVGLVLLSFRRRPTIIRGLAIVCLLALAAGEWWFLLGYVRLPAYHGPVAAGESFPAFDAEQSDGTRFTQANLPGDRDTALIFFRGHW
jgi:hypothetical protein